jgi:hypothetical protein
MDPKTDNDATCPDGSGSTAGKRRRIIRRELALTPWYEERLASRMKERSVSFNEVIRRLVDESEGRHGRLARLEIRQRVTAIKLLCHEARLHPSRLERLAMRIEQVADEITGLADASA